jgi:hypothetical protein
MSTRPIDEALRRLDAVLHECDEPQRSHLLALAHESRRRDAQVLECVAVSHEMLDNLRMGQRSSESAQHVAEQNIE